MVVHPSFSLQGVFVFNVSFAFKVMGSACARDRRALQQLVMNVHVKHSDLT